MNKRPSGWFGAPPANSRLARTAQVAAPLITATQMRSVLGWLGVIVVAMGMSGCAPFLPRAPHYTAPPLPVADSFSTGGADGANVTAAWRDYFADPRLRELITQALENNRDLRTAALRVEEIRAAYRIQRAALFPAAGIGANAILAGMPGNSSLTGKSSTLDYRQVGLNLAGWEIDFWGRLRNLKNAALENYLASEEAHRAATVILIAQVADAYLVLRELDERILLARQTIASREKSFHIFTRRFEVGSTSRLDLIQVETLLRQAQTLGTQLEQERAIQAHALTLLAGTPVDLAVTQERFSDQGMLRELRAGMPSDLLLRRPDIIAAEHQLRAAHANIGAARAAFFPRVTLTGSAGTTSVELDGLFSAPGLFSSGSGSWNFMPSISLPIFDGGRNRSNLNLAEVRRNIAVANYEKTVQAAFRDVSDAMSAQQWLTEQVRIQTATFAAQSERARLATLRYDNGAASFLEVLDAQREVLAGEQQLVQIRRALLSSRVRLYAALGGGA
jgi:outer membrane protein, multidrug efflux system